MTYDDTQFAELSQFEESFDTARHGYARPLRRGAIERIAQIHREATGSKIRGNGRCSECALRVLRLVGTYYFDDKEERAALAVQKAPISHEVGTADKSVKKIKKTVKTAKKGK